MSTATGTDSIYAAAEKDFSGRQARAALAGYELVKLADGSYIASRWGMFRSLDHLAAVDQFLVRIGAPA